MSRDMDVYLGDQRAGTLAQDDTGALTFLYTKDYLGTTKPQIISVSMPLREQPYPDRITRPYFSGLLPDERARQRLASALGVSEGNAFGLLEIIGGECAGALSLYPTGQKPPVFDSIGIEELTDKQLEAILEKLRSRPLLGGEDGVRLSLAGAQDKLAVCVDGKTIGLAKGGRATTHILKPFIEALDGTVENEMFCMRLAARMKISTPEVGMRTAGKIAFILVERYDRVKREDGKIIRLHQEDFCQALSIPPELKYEKEGGPGVVRSLSLIQSATARPGADRLTFIRRMIFHYLIGNADAHAKNFALLYRDNVPDLAPAYDVLCTAAYPRIAKDMAMAIGGRSIPDTIQLNHWLSIVPETKGAQGLIVKEIQEIASTIGAEADKLLQELLAEGVSNPILSMIRKIIEKRSYQLLRIIEK
jgi:serine/threonine-protein kinase HipA